MTFKQALDEYQSRVSILKRGYETEVHKLSVLKRSILSSMDISSIKGHHIASYRDSRLASKNPKTGNLLTSSTVLSELNLLSHIFDTAILEWGIEIENPVKKVRKPKPNAARERRLSSREEKQIFNYARKYPNPELLVIILIAIETCMRQSEILGMKWSDIDLKKRIVRLHMTKNGSSREVPLTETAVSTLRKFQHNNEFVFTYKSCGLKTVWKTMINRLGITNLRFHDLRHEGISRLFEVHGLDIVSAATISGHKSLSMLRRYTHLRASNIVKKLGKQQKKSHQAVAQVFNPYPVYLTKFKDNAWKVEVPDLSCSLSNLKGGKHQAIIEAKSFIATEVLRRIGLSQSVPAPDSYLTKHLGERILIDPMTMQH
ncbi:MAG: site-specific integrase [Methyloprofundus sp.]|nr:site-specific integrase [Methyloprofundus sp.]